MGMERNGGHSEGEPLLSVMVTARLGGPALRLTEDERRAIREGRVRQPEPGLWDRLADWWRLY